MRDGDYEAAFLDVRLGAIAANYRAYQRLAGPAAIAGMVKADAYGLGAGMVAPALADAGCDSFFVARRNWRAGACRLRAAFPWI